MLKFFNDEAGATAIEYGMIAAATALAIITVLPQVSSSLNTTFTSIAGSL